MRWTLAVAALAVAAAAAPSGHAQNVNSDWSLGGGVGISRHATGFSGTLGDPEYSGSSMPPTLRYYTPGRGPGYAPPGAGGPGYAPVTPGYAPPGSAPFEYYNSPGRR